jgi:hypothetical protein
LAASAYGKAASSKSTKEFTPQYLMKQALAYQEANELEKAKDSYKRVVEEYETSREFLEAQKYLSMLESKK